MNIIIDTREQKPLIFTGHETISRKLDEGDYNIEELEDKIVIERKSLQDFYQSITSDHIRFRAEILRAVAKQKVFYIFIEGNLEYFYTMEWSERKLIQKPATLKKIVETMTKKYNLIIIECETREIMSNLIVSMLERNKKLMESE